MACHGSDECFVWTGWQTWCVRGPVPTDRQQQTLVMPLLLLTSTAQPTNDDEPSLVLGQVVPVDRRLEGGGVGRVRVTGPVPDEWQLLGPCMLVVDPGCHPSQVSAALALGTTWRAVDAWVCRTQESLRRFHAAPLPKSCGTSIDDVRGREADHRQGVWGQWQRDVVSYWLLLGVAHVCRCAGGDSWTALADRCLDGGRGGTTSSRQTRYLHQARKRSERVVRLSCECDCVRAATADVPLIAPMLGGSISVVRGVEALRTIELASALVRLLSVECASFLGPLVGASQHTCIAPTNVGKRLPFRVSTWTGGSPPHRPWCPTTTIPKRFPSRACRRWSRRSSDSAGASRRPRAPSGACWPSSTTPMTVSPNSGTRTATSSAQGMMTRRSSSPPAGNATADSSV